MSSSCACFEAFTGCGCHAARQAIEAISWRGTRDGRTVAHPLAQSCSAELPPQLSTVSLSFFPGVQFRALRAGSVAGDDEAPSGCFGDATGYSPWWGGLLLAAWIAQAPSDLFRNRKVIELGCGAAAMPSVVASMRGAATVRATDRLASNVSAASSAFACNKTSSTCCSAQRFAWEDGIDQKEVGSWDMVLFADVLYIEGMAAILARAVASLLLAGGEVLAAVAMHRPGASEIFSEMQCRGFVVREILVLGEVRSSASQASGLLHKATLADPAAAMGLEGPSNECKLLSWVRAGHPAHSGPDMADELRHQVHIRQEKAVACEVWLMTE